MFKNSYFMCMDVLSAHLSMYHLCAVSEEARRKHWITETVVTDRC